MAESMGFNRAEIVARWGILGALVVSYGVAQCLAFPFRDRINTRWAKFLIHSLGIRLQVLGKPSLAHQIVVSNHTSWLDPLP
jgi:1-acyl-sn-glycerol-3-phosphate acyltransferase